MRSTLVVVALAASSVLIFVQVDAVPVGPRSNRQTSSDLNQEITLKHNGGLYTADGYIPGLKGGKAEHDRLANLMNAMLMLLDEKIVPGLESHAAGPSSNAGLPKPPFQFETVSK
ncbi:hypothetical protein B566_EDAN009512 [Ephemera danica]|nr:hypothetical protein B566_EDAN009512 [Ephemera danica]